MSYKGNDLKDRLYRFYYIYQKDKLGDIDGLVAKYKAQEAKLFEKLVEKYGKEPTIEEFEKAVNAASPAKSAAAKGSATDGEATGSSSKSSETKAKSSQAKSSSASAGAKASSASKKESLLDKYTPRSRLTRFYTKYAPDKLADIEKFLTKIESDPKQENMLFQMLVKKYGPEPEVEGDDDDEEEDNDDDDNDDNEEDDDDKDEDDDEDEEDEEEEEEEETGRAKGAKALSKNAKLVKSLKGKKGKDVNENDANRPSIIKDIEYCPVNGLPAEYCESAPASFQQSLPWLAENYPDMVLLSQKKITVTEYIHKLAETHKLNKDSFPSLSDLAAALPSKGGAVASAPAAGEGSAANAGAAATDGKAAKKGKGAKEKVVLIEATQRQKRKFVTTITGLDLFDNVKIKDAAKLFGKKFACGATVSEEGGKKFIEVQGDITYDVPDFIVDVFKIPKDVLFLVEKGTKTPAFADDGKVKIKAAGKKKDAKPAQAEENNEDEDE